MYHINLEGQARECHAEIACPFGSFDTDHYTTAEQARAAYEAAMKGQAVATFTKRDAHFAALSEEERRAETARLERVKELSKLKAPTTAAPKRPESGYLVKLKEFSDLKVGDILPDGRVVDGVYGFKKTKSSKYPSIVMFKGEVDHLGLPVQVLAEDLNLEGLEVWRDEVHPEAQEAYDALQLERAIEDSALNWLKPQSSLKRLGQTTPAHRAYNEYYKFFKKSLEDLQRSGIALPHTRALELTLNRDVAYSYPQQEAIRVFEVIARQNDLQPHNKFYTSSAGPEIFGAGRVPVLDFNPRTLLEERDELGLT